jgi:hypothetical protein
MMNQDLSLKSWKAKKLMEIPLVLSKILTSPLTKDFCPERHSVPENLGS